MQLRQRFRNIRRPDKKDAEAIKGSESTNDDQLAVDESGEGETPAEDSREGEALAEESGNGEPPPPKRKKRAQMSERAGESDDYQMNVVMLKKELEREAPRSSVVKSLMQATFDERRQWIVQERPPISDVLDLFPCLSQEKYVS